MLGISDNFLLADSFVMSCFFTWVILMPSIHWIMWCTRISSFWAGMCEAPSSHICTWVGWWGWQVIWGTCCIFWRWHLNKICGGLPLMNFLLLGVRQCRIFFKESIICISQSNWSAWYRWWILVSFWWLLFLCNWCILHPRLCVSVYHYIYYRRPGWS